MEAIDNVFELGILLVFDTHVWLGSKRLTKNQMKHLTKEEKIEWVNATKKLIDKEALTDIRAIVSKCRSIIDSASLPFPIESMRFIPKDLVDEISDKLNEAIEVFNENVSIFEENYEEYIDKAEKILEPRGLFDREDYPDNIRDKFGITYRFLEMSVPGELQKFSPKIYKEEQEKFKALMEETRNEAIIFLREAFLEVVNHITEILTGEQNSGEARVIRQGTLDKLDKFFEEFQTKNIFKDKELSKIINEARDVMFGIDSASLKMNTRLREKIGEKMEKVQDVLSKSITKFKRTVDL